MGVRTVLQAGVDNDVVDEIARIEKEIADREKRQEELTKKLQAAKKIQHKLTEEKKAGLTALMKRSDMATAETKAMCEKLKSLRKKIYDKSASITINKAVHAGVVSKIGKHEKILHQDFDGFRRFVWDEEKYDIEAVYD